MKFTIDLFAIELTPVSYHFGLIAAMGRRKPRFIVDTGASQTVISLHLAQQAGLETDIPDIDNLTIGIGQESLSPQFTLIQSLRLNNLKIKNIPCIVLPMDHINNTYKSIGQKSVDGILGSDLLYLLNAQINLKKLKIQFESVADEVEYNNLVRYKGLNISLIPHF